MARARRPPAAAAPRLPGGLPNALSLAGLGLGFLAALDAGRGDAPAALRQLALAALAEALAGRAARGLKLASPLGAELDSLAALVVWGLAVPLLLHAAALQAWGWPGAALAGALCLAGAWRLCRGDAARPLYRGLPLRAAGLLLAAAAALGAPAWALAGSGLALAALQLGPWDYPRPELPAAAAAPLFLSLAAAALLPAPWGWVLPGLAAAAYAAAGPFLNRRPSA